MQNQERLAFAKELKDEYLTAAQMKVDGVWISKETLFKIVIELNRQVSLCDTAEIMNTLANELHDPIEFMEYFESTFKGTSNDDEQHDDEEIEDFDDLCETS